VFELFDRCTVHAQHGRRWWCLCNAHVNAEEKNWGGGSESSTFSSSITCSSTSLCLPVLAVWTLLLFCWCEQFPCCDSATPSVSFPLNGIISFHLHLLSVPPFRDLSEHHRDPLANILLLLLPLPLPSLPLLLPSHPHLSSSLLLLLLYLFSSPPILPPAPPLNTSPQLIRDSSQFLSNKPLSPLHTPLPYPLMKPRCNI
jgi:hypothetical protein